MLDFGKELKAAREAKGLTIANVAETTHIMSAVLEDLENENFSRIVAPIYGRGFVKLYCETVGLDPKPFVAEFMDIYNGRRDPAIRERVASQPPLPTESPVSVASATPEPEFEPETETVVESADTATDEPLQEPPDEPSIEPPHASEPAQIPEPTAEIPPQPSLFDPPSTWERPTPTPIQPEVQSPAKPHLGEPPRFTRYSAPLSDRFADVTELKQIVVRWAMLGVVALVVLWGAVAGIRALYNATRTPGDTDETPKAAPIVETNETVESLPATETGEAAQPRPPRTPIAVSPLYID